MHITSNSRWGGATKTPHHQHHYSLPGWHWGMAVRSVIHSKSTGFSLQHNLNFAVTLLPTSPVQVRCSDDPTIPVTTANYYGIIVQGSFSIENADSSSIYGILIIFFKKSNIISFKVNYQLQLGIVYEHQES